MPPAITVPGVRIWGAYQVPAARAEEAPPIPAADYNANYLKGNPASRRTAPVGRGRSAGQPPKSVASTFAGSDAAKADLAPAPPASSYNANYLRGNPATRRRYPTLNGPMTAAKAAAILQGASELGTPLKSVAKQPSIDELLEMVKLMSKLELSDEEAENLQVVATRLRVLKAAGNLSEAEQMELADIAQTVAETARTIKEEDMMTGREERDAAIAKAYNDEASAVAEAKDLVDTWNDNIAIARHAESQLRGIRRARVRLGELAQMQNPTHAQKKERDRLRARPLDADEEKFTASLREAEYNIGVLGDQMVEAGASIDALKDASRAEVAKAPPKIPSKRVPTKTKYGKIGDAVAEAVASVVAEAVAATPGLGVEVPPYEFPEVVKLEEKMSEKEAYERLKPTIATLLKGNADKAMNKANRGLFLTKDNLQEAWAAVGTGMGPPWTSRARREDIFDIVKGEPVEQQVLFWDRAIDILKDRRTAQAAMYPAAIHLPKA